MSVVWTLCPYGDPAPWFRVCQQISDVTSVVWTSAAFASIFARPTTSECSMPRAASRKSPTTNVRAVERAIEILEAFSRKKPAMSVIEIQKAVGLSRPTLYRLLETLASKGLIRAHGTPQRFSLDYGVGRLAQNWLSGLDSVAVARPILERLHEEANDTVAL